jgi:aryl-alcohol dehydrogenase-like predicted oxidoreductase
MQMEMKRRDFLAALSLSAGYLMFRNPLAAQGAELFYDTDPFQAVKLGKSGLVTSLLGMGTGVHAGNRQSFLTRQDKNKSLALLEHAYEKGIRFFDCADSYGTHPLMAEVFRILPREQLTISSKIWMTGGNIPETERADADIVVDRFRKELNTDYLDLVQFHCMTERDWTDKFKAQMDIMDRLKSKGIIRAHGVSVHSLDAMKAAAESDWVDVVHVRINPYGIAMDKPDPEDVIGVIHELHNKGKGVIGMKLVGDGDYRDDSEKVNHSIRFVLGLGSVDMMIVGFEVQAVLSSLNT